MNEDQIERVVERSTDKADRRFMAGIMSQAEYDAEMEELNAWAQRKYDENACKHSFVTDSTGLIDTCTKCGVGRA